jgi:hypothetical protein
MMSMRREYPYVFNIGLNRAGTTSLTEALGILGIETLHHKHNGIRLFDLMQQNLRLGYRVFYGLDHLYRGFSDFAGQYFFKLIDQQYPGSKFILTTRDLDTWLDSRERKVRKNLANPDYRYHFRSVNRQGWAEEYHAFHRAATEYFADRDNDFLILDIPSGEGWEKLCTFLDKPMPTALFPKRNALTDL